MIASSETESIKIYDGYVARIETVAPGIATIASSIKAAKFPGALVPVGDDVLFAVAPDHLAWRALAPLLEARIAYQLSDLPHPQGAGDPPAELTALLSGYKPAVWIRVRFPRKLQRLTITACARLVENVLDHAELMEVPSRQPTSAELLGALEVEMTRNDLAEAERILQRLSTGNYLDGLNVRFLRLRVLEARGDSEAQVRRICAQIKGLNLPSRVRSIVDQYGGA